jgi:hypothetical protein
VDAIEAMEQFLARVGVCDPPDLHPDVTTTTIEMRVGRARGSFALSDRAARVLVDVLARYADQEDHGDAAEIRRRFAEEARNWQPR